MSDSIDPKPLPEPSDVGVSQADERDAALAAVIREQTQKAEMEAHASKDTHPAPGSRVTAFDAIPRHGDLRMDLCLAARFSRDGIRPAHEQ